MRILQKLRDPTLRVYVLIGIITVVIALGAPLISHDVPILCKTDDGVSLPIFQPKKYRTHRGGVRDRRMTDICHWALYPLMRYHPSNLDPSIRFLSPDKHHWLGTDGLGRDTLVSLLYGLRIALIISLLSMLVALGVGLVLGGLTGYLADDKIRMRWPEIMLQLFIGLYMLFLIRSVMSLYDLGWVGIAGFLLLWVGTHLSAHRLMGRYITIGAYFSLPLDLIIMRIIEVLKSIPALFLLMVLVGYLEHIDVYAMGMIIGLFSGPHIARIVRGEIIKIKSYDYVKSASLLNFSEWQIFRIQVLPNIMGPLFVALSFTAANAVLLESGLSFLGLGLSADQVSWGSLLNDARKHFSAWWLALAPGTAIFMLILYYNRLGHKIEKLYQSDQSQ